jgi:hypothetical protein
MIVPTLFFILLLLSILTFAVVKRGVVSGSLSDWMQRFEKCDKRCRLRRTQIHPPGRLFYAALDHLADKLVLRKTPCDTVQSWTSLFPTLTKRMTVAALPHLKAAAPTLFSFTGQKWKKKQTDTGC